MAELEDGGHRNGGEKKNVEKNWATISKVNNRDAQRMCIPATRAGGGALEHFLLELALEDHWQQRQHGEDGQHRHGPPGDRVSGRAQLM